MGTTVYVSLCERSQLHGIVSIRALIVPLKFIRISNTSVPARSRYIHKELGCCITELTLTAEFVTVPPQRLLQGPSVAL